MNVESCCLQYIRSYWWRPSQAADSVIMMLPHEELSKTIGHFLGEKRDYSWSVPGVFSKSSEGLSVIVFSDRGKGQAHRTDAVQNVKNTGMTVFSKSTASRQDNDAAFPAMIEWATATNRAIAPMEFPDALHYLMKNQKIALSPNSPWGCLNFPERINNRPPHAVFLYGGRSP